MIHMFWNVDNDDKIDPPIHTKNFLYSGAWILTFTVAGASETNSLLSLSAIPGNIVVPPLNTMLEKSYFLTSTSQVTIEL